MFLTESPLRSLQANIQRSSQVLRQVRGRRLYVQRLTDKLNRLSSQKEFCCVLLQNNKSQRVRSQKLKEKNRERIKLQQSRTSLMTQKRKLQGPSPRQTAASLYSSKRVLVNEEKLLRKSFLNQLSERKQRDQETKQSKAQQRKKQLQQRMKFVKEFKQRRSQSILANNRDERMRQLRDRRQTLRRAVLKERKLLSCRQNQLQRAGKQNDRSQAKLQEMLRRL